MPGVDHAVLQGLQRSVRICFRCTKPGYLLLADTLDVLGRKGRIKRHIGEYRPDAVKTLPCRGQRNGAIVAVHAHSNGTARSRKLASYSLAIELFSSLDRRIQHETLNSGVLFRNVSRTTANKQAGGDGRSSRPVFEDHL